MAHGRLEHVNITVRDSKATAQMLVDLFGWRIRWEGKAANDGYTVHVGDADKYLAVYTPKQTRDVANQNHTLMGGLNHVGVVVDDLDAAEGRVAAAGFEPFNHADYDPGRRFYFFDQDGIEWEVVSYA